MLDLPHGASGSPLPPRPLPRWLLVAVLTSTHPCLSASNDGSGILATAPPPSVEQEYHPVHEPAPPPQVHVTPEQGRTLGLTTEPVALHAIGDYIHAPGEVRPNAYASAQVTPRLSAQVVERHVHLGDQVTQGQPLVTLSSVDMADAQGDLVVAELEWRRLDRIKDRFVSDKEYQEAAIARQKARSRVLAFGMTPTQMDTLAADTGAHADGTFVLLAPRPGTLVQDDFIIGEQVQPGRMLFEITDESVRWIEAQLSPQDAARVHSGDPARVAVRAGDDWLEGRVTQSHHRIDETSRTQAVRIEVPDPGHQLHPGEFVDTLILVGTPEPALAVPESALLRAQDGDWQVFVAEGEDTFALVDVRLIRTTGGLAVIDGLAQGTRVVTGGAFFLQSELAKGHFDPHNH